MGSGEVAIVALSTMISLKVTFSDGLGGGEFGLIPLIPVRLLNSLLSVWQSMATELHCSSIVVTQRCFKMSSLRKPRQ